jgi:SAM-dependent methyltransferase
VLDVGCGAGFSRAVVEAVGGRWTGVEPFEGGGQTVTANSEALPFPDFSFDVVLMNSVLQHLPELEKSFSEAARVLRKGGVFVGYVAFMECFQEISYNHLSFKALEYLSEKNGLKLRSVSGGGSFGIDYHLSILLYPLPFRTGRIVIAAGIRLLVAAKAAIAYGAQRIFRRRSHGFSITWARKYYQLECLRQSSGFEFIIDKQ